jgi:hypothetical protein
MRAVLVAAALAALALPPAHAADGDKGSGARAAAKTEQKVKKDTAAAERSADRKKDAAAEPGDDRKEARPAARVGDDLTTCKRDADGMRGPERSRFMTDCLKERR